MSIIILFVRFTLKHFLIRQCYHKMRRRPLLVVLCVLRRIWIGVDCETFVDECSLVSIEDCISWKESFIKVPRTKSCDWIRRFCLDKIIRPCLDFKSYTNEVVKRRNIFFETLLTTLHAFSISLSFDSSKKWVHKVKTLFELSCNF